MSKDRNYLTELRDTYMGSWPRSVAYITFAVLAGWLIQFIGAHFGYFDDKPTMRTLIVSVLGCSIVVFSAWLVKRRWPNNNQMESER